MDPGTSKQRSSICAGSRLPLPLFVLSAVVVVLLALLASRAWFGRAGVAAPAAEAERAARPQPIPRAPASAPGTLPDARSEAPVEPPASEGPTSDDLESLPARARPADRAAWTEREFLEEFDASAAADPLGFRVRVREALFGEGPACEKVAALRALYAWEPETGRDLCVEAIARLPDASSPRGESVPRTALRLLGERAPREPAARSILERVLWSQDFLVSAELRGVAAAALLAATAEPELSTLRRRLQDDPEERVRSRAVDPRPSEADADGAEGGGR